MQQTDTIVIGAGQAGLATSHELTQRGVDHVVLEKGRIGRSWRNRWDTFCLVTPTWSVQVPGFPYDGDDPDGFMPRAVGLSPVRRSRRVLVVPEIRFFGRSCRGTAAGGAPLCQCACHGTWRWP